jgi:hypothetical protein
MFLNKIIFLLAFFLVISEVNSKCETTTKENDFGNVYTTTWFIEITPKRTVPETDFNKKITSTREFGITGFNPFTVVTQKSNISKKTVTSTIKPYQNNSKTTDNSNQVTTIATIASTTTIEVQSNTCKIVNQSSHKYGYSAPENFKLEKYTIELSNVKDLQIFSNQDQVNGFKVIDNNSNVFSIGDVSNSGNIEDLINLENKTIVEMNVRTENKIISIQFRIHDLLNNTYSWTRQIGNTNFDHNQGKNTINSETEKRPNYGSDFKITQINVWVYSNYVSTLQVEYTYNTCKTLENKPSVPSNVAQVEKPATTQE